MDTESQNLRFVCWILGSPWCPACRASLIDCLVTLWGWWGAITILTGDNFEFILETIWIRALSSDFSFSLYVPDFSSYFGIYCKYSVPLKQDKILYYKNFFTKAFCYMDLLDPPPWVFLLIFSQTCLPISLCALLAANDVKTIWKVQTAKRICIN